MAQVFRKKLKLLGNIDQRTHLKRHTVKPEVLNKLAAMRKTKRAYSIFRNKLEHDLICSKEKGNI